MTNIIQFLALAREAQALQPPTLRLSEDGSAIEVTLHDTDDNLVALLEYRLHERSPKDFDLGRWCALFDLLREQQNEHRTQQ
jgi:hypothetical protein